MTARPSRDDLIAIAEKLLKNSYASVAEANELMAQFEKYVPYPNAGELIMFEKDQFRSAAELVDFAFAEEQIPRLSRQELIEVADRIMNCRFTSIVEDERLSRQFDANVPHPDGTGLIFYPKDPSVEFKTAEEVVDYSLAYREPSK